jgi:uncharacterized protein involved in type VI secretion and phage assembly
MYTFDDPLDGASQADRLFGVAVGLVTNTADPEGLGRVKVSLPWMADDVETTWARVAAPMAGSERGMFFPPEVDDEVLVAFEHGSPDAPYVLGALWNGKDLPPEDNKDGANDRRVIVSRSGQMIRFNDKEGEEEIEIVDSGGATSIVINSKDHTVTIKADADITIDASKGTLTLRAKEISVRADQTIELQAQASMTLKGQTVNIN